MPMAEVMLPQHRYTWCKLKLWQGPKVQRYSTQERRLGKVLQFRRFHVQVRVIIPVNHCKPVKNRDQGGPVLPNSLAFIHFFFDAKHNCAFTTILWLTETSIFLRTHFKYPVETRPECTHAQIFTQPGLFATCK